MAAKAVIMFLGVLVVCSSAAPQERPCVEISPGTTNAEVAWQMDSVLRRMYVDNVDRPQPEYNLPTLEPLNVGSAGPYQTALLPGLNITFEFSNLVRHGLLRNNNFTSVLATGQGNTRTIRYSVTVGRWTLPNLTIRITSPINWSGTSTVTVANVDYRIQHDLSRSGLSNIQVQTRVRGPVISVPPITQNPVIQRDITEQLLRDIAVTLRRLMRNIVC